MVSCSSFWASEFDRPNAAIRSTNLWIRPAVASSSYAASTSECSDSSNSCTGLVQVVEVPASRAAFST